MGRLIYSMITSLDGYTEDARGDFTWGEPDEPVLSYITELTASVGTYLYGRRMYEAMLFWETADELHDASETVRDWTRQWQAAEKVVYSKTLPEVRSARTRIERDFEPEAVRRLKEETPHDLTVDGPGLASHAIRAGLVDEYQMIVCPVVVGGGKRFFPDDVQLVLELRGERRFDNGMVVLRYTSLG